MDSGRTKKELGSSRNSATGELDTQFDERYRRLRADFDNYRRRSEVKLASAGYVREGRMLRPAQVVIAEEEQVGDAMERRVAT